MSLYPLNACLYPDVRECSMNDMQYCDYGTFQQYGNDSLFRKALWFVEQNNILNDCLARNTVQCYEQSHVCPSNCLTSQAD